MLGLGGMNSITLVNFYYESLRVDTRVIGKHIDHTRYLNSISLLPVLQVEDQSPVSRTVGEEPTHLVLVPVKTRKRFAAMSVLGRTASTRE